MNACPPQNGQGLRLVCIAVSILEQIVLVILVNVVALDVVDDTPDMDTCIEGQAVIEDVLQSVEHIGSGRNEPRVSDGLEELRSERDIIPINRCDEIVFITSRVDDAVFRVISPRAFSEVNHNQPPNRSIVQPEVLG